MTKLPIADALFGHGTICESKFCNESGNCANHNTAGREREYFGRTPILSLSDGVISCRAEFITGASGFLYRRKGRWAILRNYDISDEDVTDLLAGLTQSPPIAADDDDEDAGPTKLIIRRFHELSCPQLSLPDENEWVDVDIIELIKTLLEDRDVDFQVHRMFNTKRIVVTVDNSKGSFQKK